MTPSRAKRCRMYGVFVGKTPQSVGYVRLTRGLAQDIANRSKANPGNPQWYVLPVMVHWTLPTPKRGKKAKI